MTVLETLAAPKFLLIDSGNTRTKAAVYQNDISTRDWIFENAELDHLREVLSQQTVDRIIMADSGKNASRISSWFPQIPASCISPYDKPLITWAYESPDGLGQDRIAALQGSLYRFKGENCCVVSAGTCITFDFLKKDGQHLGGFISPGLEMRLKSMHKFTSSLPYVSKNESSKYPGVDTASCLSGGAVWGAVLEIEGHLQRCIELFSDDWKLILTGGDADFLAQRIKADNFVAPNLIMEGLNRVAREALDL